MLAEQESQCEFSAFEFTFLNTHGLLLKQSCLWTLSRLTSLRTDDSVFVEPKAQLVLVSERDEETPVFGKVCQPREQGSLSPPNRCSLFLGGRQLCPDSQSFPLLVEGGDWGPVPLEDDWKVCCLRLPGPPLSACPTAG